MGEGKRMIYDFRRGRQRDFCGVCVCERALPTGHVPTSYVPSSSRLSDSDECDRAHIYAIVCSCPCAFSIFAELILSTAHRRSSKWDGLILMQREKKNVFAKKKNDFSMRHFLNLKT